MYVFGKIQLVLEITGPNDDVTKIIVKTMNKK